MNTKNNKRHIDTENRIKNTLLELAKTTGIRQITVSAICSEAAINRSTFYAHYLDINDLVDKMGKDMMLDIAHLFERTDNPVDFFLSEPLLTEMLSYVKEHSDFFDIYLNHYSSNANETFSLMWEYWFKPYFQNMGLSDEAEMWYHFTFFKAGFLAVLSQWLHKGCPETPEFLSHIILKRLPASIEAPFLQ